MDMCRHHPHKIIGQRSCDSDLQQNTFILLLRTRKWAVVVKIEMIHWNFVINKDFYLKWFLRRLFKKKMNSARIAWRWYSNIPSSSRHHSIWLPAVAAQSFVVGWATVASIEWVRDRYRHGRHCPPLLSGRDIEILPLPYSHQETLLGERCTGWLIFFIFALKVLLFDVLSRTWSYKIE